LTISRAAIAAFHPLAEIADTAWRATAGGTHTKLVSGVLAFVLKACEDAPWTNLHVLAFREALCGWQVCSLLGAWPDPLLK